MSTRQSIFTDDSSANPAQSSASTAPSTVAGPSESNLNEEHDEIRATVHRRRIPRVEKDADDPTCPVQSRNPDRNESTTLTTLSRLFAVASPLSESQSQLSSMPLTTAYPRVYPTEAASLTDHLLSRGFLSGKHSDITVHAFGYGYRLHRLILDRAPFFSTALSGQWLEGHSKEMTLKPDEVDSNITRDCFELAIKRLYGANVAEEEAKEAKGLFATGCWLEMPDLIDSSIESMLRQMKPGNLATLIKLVTTNYYGRAGDKILASTKAMLCRDGWKMPIRHWDGIPSDIIREIVGGDGFYINGEWDRWVLAKRLLDRRLKSLALDAGLVRPGTRKILRAPDAANLNAVRFDAVYRRDAMSAPKPTPDSVHRWIMLYTHYDVEPLLVLLDEGIHYVHLEFEHLQYMRRATDVLGMPMMPQKVISDALWMQMELRQKVLNTSQDDMELGFSEVIEGGAMQVSPSKETTMAILDPLSPGKGKQKEGKEGISAHDFQDDEDTDIPSNSWDANGKPRKFWIPSADCNIVMGGNADPVIATSTPAGTQRHTSRLSATIQPEDVQWAADFGIASADTRPFGRPGSSFGSATAPEVRPMAYSNFPPFRFAAEFPNPRVLKEKKRVYSRTIFYAGSLWNIYIQKVRSSKNLQQLGVYLHRAKERETEEAVSNSAGLGQRSVDERIGQLERELLVRADRLGSQGRRRRRQADRDGEPELETGDSSGSADPDLTHVVANALPQLRNTLGRLSGVSTSSQSGYRRSGQADLLSTDSPRTSDEYKRADSVTHDDDSTDDDDDDSELQKLSRAPLVPTLPPYVDGRPTIKTYFKIYSPSKGGRMLSVYESAPDKFNFSQSWGWKSSTLMLDEGIIGEDGPPVSVEAIEGEGDAQGVGAGVRKEAKLRFMVVIGNV